MKEGDLRVWWIPQIPMKNPFKINVKTIDEAILLLNTLALYDLYQLKHKIKPDYSNVGGLEIFKDGEWSEYHDEQDRDIDEIIEDGDSQ